MSSQERIVDPLTGNEYQIYYPSERSIWEQVGDLLVQAGEWPVLLSIGVAAALAVLSVLWVVQRLSGVRLGHALDADWIRFPISGLLGKSPFVIRDHRDRLAYEFEDRGWRAAKARRYVLRLVTSSEEEQKEVEAALEAALAGPLLGREEGSVHAYFKKPPSADEIVSALDACAGIEDRGRPKIELDSPGLMRSAGWRFLPSVEAVSFWGWLGSAGAVSGVMVVIVATLMMDWLETFFRGSRPLILVIMGAVSMLGFLSGVLALGLGRPFRSPSTQNVVLAGILANASVLGYGGFTVVSTFYLKYQAANEALRLERLAVESPQVLHSEDGAVSAELPPGWVVSSVGPGAPVGAAHFSKGLFVTSSTIPKELLPPRPLRTQARMSLGNMKRGTKAWSASARERLESDGNPGYFFEISFKNRKVHYTMATSFVDTLDAVHQVTAWAPDKKPRDEVRAALEEVVRSFRFHGPSRPPTTGGGDGSLYDEACPPAAAYFICFVEGSPGMKFGSTYAGKFALNRIVRGQAEQLRFHWQEVNFVISFESARSRFMTHEVYRIDGGAHDLVIRDPMGKASCSKARESGFYIRSVPHPDGSSSESGLMIDFNCGVLDGEELNGRICFNCLPD